MAYDFALAERIRHRLSDLPNISECKMFGGLAFLVSGNMTVVASGKGGIMVRVDPKASEQLVAKSSATLAEMRGRQLKGWLRISAEHVRTSRELNKWTDLAIAYVNTLPRKKK